AIMARLIGHESALTRDVLANDRPDNIEFQIANVEGARVASTLDQSQHLAAVRSPAPPSWPTLHVGHESFVGLAGAILAAQRRQEGAGTHGLPQSVFHEPRGLIGDAQRPMQLMGANAFLAA